ncbi:MAG: type II toxin-antitoxin system VapC family toxin [Actinomycetota bacterium]
MPAKDISSAPVVVDASVVRVACLSPGGFRWLETYDAIAPPLMWSEVLASLHQGLWRGEISREEAERARGALERAPVKSRAPAGLREEAWKLAEQLGWAKTYDAEYLALARLAGCRMITFDARLIRGTRRLGFVGLPLALGRGRKGVGGPKRRS